MARNLHIGGLLQFGCPAGEMLGQDEVVDMTGNL